MWVKLKSIQYLLEQGKQIPHYPGEWVEVQNGHGRRLIATGEAVRPDMPDLAGFTDSGVMAADESYLSAAMSAFDCPMQISSEYGPAFHKTLRLGFAWKNVRPDLFVLGFHLLDTWDAAIPLKHYDTLAKDIGDEADREMTEDLIHDLRVPVYDDRLVYVRRSPDGIALMDAWQEEAGRGGASSPALALLRAVYRVKPLILALPCTWIVAESVT